MWHRTHGLFDFDSLMLCHAVCPAASRQGVFTRGVSVPKPAFSTRAEAFSVQALPSGAYFLGELRLDGQLTEVACGCCEVCMLACDVCLRASSRPTELTANWQSHSVSCRLNPGTNRLRNPSMLRDPSHPAAAFFRLGIATSAFWCLVAHVRSVVPDCTGLLYASMLSMRPLPFVDGC